MGRERGGCCLSHNVVVMAQQRMLLCDSRCARLQFAIAAHLLMLHGLRHFGVAFSTTCACTTLPPTPPPLTWQVLCVSSVKPDGSLSVSAKISDFGLALRAMPLPTGRGWGTVTAQPRGTPAYMAPEMLGQRDGQGCVEVGPV